jgi:GNAT superfamily N-acetyltransferase
MPWDVRSLALGDRAWVATLIRERWGDDIVVARGRIVRPTELPGVVAIDAGQPVGLLTYEALGEACEIVTIDAVRRREGIGRALVEAAARAAREAGCRRLELITTNDNGEAHAFYRACGFTLVAVHEGAIDRSRAIKPSIPLVDDRGVPIRDELEFARDLR